MTSFQEFLRKKAEEHPAPSPRARRGEWIEAVNRLNDQILQWLHESDPEGLIEITRVRFSKADAGLGSYDISGLEIGVGDRSVQVRPVARNVAGSSFYVGEGSPLAGRVDITNGFEKYILKRVLINDNDAWEIVNDQGNGGPLDRARLEMVLQDLLG